MPVHPRLRWGILGTGNIAGQFAAGVNDSDRGTLAAVGSRRMETAQHFAATWHVSRVHATYEALLADPAVDAIYVSLPNSMHYEWTLKSLRAGKHVLCEKPLAVNLAEAEEMFAEARAAQRVLVEAFMYRSHPQTLAVQKALADGLIGDVRIIRSSFVYATGKIAGNVRFDKSLAGGSLMDIGCYCLSFSRMIAGAEPTGMTAHGHLHDSGVDDYAAGILAFPHNILATFACGMTVHADNTAHILGTRGYLEIPIPWKPPANSEFHIMNETGKRETRKVSTDKHLYALEADDFAATVQDGTPPRVTMADSLGNQRCLDALRAQIA